MSMPEAFEQFKRDLEKKFTKTLEAFLTFHENRDPHLLTLLSGIPPPKELIYARSKFLTKLRLTKSEKLKKVLRVLIERADELLDLYQKPPVLVESMLKGVATSEDELEVITD